MICVDFPPKLVIFAGAMSVPGVSVLIPVFNGQRFLVECLESVLQQDLDGMEIIIVDDGSTDNSASIIDDYARRDGRIRWWKNGRNVGIGENWNACLRRARGELIKFVLQDDKLMDPSVLRRQSDLLRQNPGVSLVASAAKRINAESQHIWIRNRFGASGIWDGKDVILKCLEARENLIGEPSVTMFRREQAQRGFDTRLVQLLDEEMWFHVLEQGSFGFIAEPLCAFREHEGQATARHWRHKGDPNEALLLIESYYQRDWVKERANGAVIFSMMHGLRKDGACGAERVIADLKEQISPMARIAGWARYSVNRPLRRLNYWFQKRFTS